MVVLELLLVRILQHLHCRKSTKGGRKIAKGGRRIQAEIELEERESMEWGGGEEVQEMERGRGKRRRKKTEVAALQE